MTKPFSSEDFRATMGKFTTGVTVVTTPADDGIHGMTANSFTSVSLNPPLVLVSVNKQANTHRYIPLSKCFGVNILRSDQRDVANHFAGKVDLDVQRKITYTYIDNIPVMTDCLASIACRLWAKYDGGDHSLYVGEVIALDANSGDPLVFFQSKYRELNRE